MDIKKTCASLVWRGCKYSYKELLELSSLYASKDISSYEWMGLAKGFVDIDFQSAEREHAWLDQRNFLLLAPWEKDYPLCFRSLKYPPFLTLMGSSDVLAKDSIAIVGSRQPSSDCISWLRSELRTFLSESRCVVISGGARGVDQEAHRACIVQKSPTICFLPSGLGRMYPPDLIHWRDKIVGDGGAFVTQFSPFTPIYKSHFHRRNELMALLASCTFVAQAKERSGSMVTAVKAMELGKEVATLPCFPTGTTGKGNLKILQAGGQMIVDYCDLLVFWERNLSSSFMNLKNCET